MPLLWYRDPADGALKPYAVPGEELSFTTYKVASQVVATGTTWVKLAGPDSDPEGDDPAAWGIGQWTAPAAGVWQIDLHTSLAEDQAIAVRITVNGQAYVQSAPSSATGQSGCGVMFLADIPAGTVVEFWLNHGKGQALAMSTVVSATRHRKFTPTAGVKADGTGDYVLKAGDTMTGPLILSGDPALSMGAATKAYADAKVVDLVWGTDPTVAPSQLSVNDAMLETRSLEIQPGAGLYGGGEIGLSPALNVGAGTGITVAADAVTLDQAYTDGLYPAKTNQVVAGDGLTGGGDLSASRTLNVGAGTGITVAADSVALNKTYTDGLYPAKTNQVVAGNGLSGGGDLSASRTLNVGAGTGITVAADTVALDKAYTDGLYGQKSRGSLHNLGSIPGDSSAGPFTVPHGLGKTPQAVTATALDDTGVMSVVLSISTWDATNVVLLARNVASGAETVRASIIAVG